MKSIQSLVFASSFVAALAALVSGCGTNPEPTSVVCTDFRAGANLSSSTFGVTGDLQRPYVAFAQAAGDLSAVANQMLHDVGAACQGLAIELGADATDARVQGKLETEAVRGWCKIAAERFANVRPRLDKAHFAVQVVTPQCTTDTTFQLACEQRCRSGTGACAEASPEDRCPVEAREGICPGVCTGTCTGSESATAACVGACTGTCFGTCSADGKDDKSGKGESGEGDGDDCSMGCACTKVCKGTCTAACALAEGAGSHCDAVCAGTCSEPMVAQTCTKALAPPTCAGDVDCQKSCGASGAARASCPEGSLAVSIDAAARTDEGTAQIVGALERHLPAVFLAARGRAKILAEGASDVLDSAGHILSHSDELGPMGAACGMLIGQTGDEARKNLNAALGGSQDLAHAVTGDAMTAPAKD